jgi:hypothetical protein
MIYLIKLLEAAGFVCVFGVAALLAWALGQGMK